MNVFNRSNATVAIPMLSAPLQMRCPQMRIVLQPSSAVSPSALRRPYLVKASPLCLDIGHAYVPLPLHNEMDAYYGYNLIDIYIYVYNSICILSKHRYRMVCRYLHTYVYIYMYVCACTYVRAVCIVSCVRVSISKSNINTAGANSMRTSSKRSSKQLKSNTIRSGLHPTGIQISLG